MTVEIAERVALSVFAALVLLAIVLLAIGVRKLWRGITSHIPIMASLGLVAIAVIAVLCLGGGSG